MPSTLPETRIKFVELSPWPNNPRPYRFRPADDMWDRKSLYGVVAARRWCQEQFGPSGTRRWGCGINNFVTFQDRNDAFWFKLVWC